MDNKSKKKVITGVKPSGTPHIGNYLGAMKPIIDLQDKYKTIIFIADLHSLTTVKDSEIHKKYIRDIALDFLALGLDPQKTIFFRQSAVPAHTELGWILSCLAPVGLLERAHAWKDALATGKKDPSVGLFTYPVLMAADILLYQTEFVPVGKDQKQHVEIARDLAAKYNHTYGERFVLPQELIGEDIATIIGTDGEHKMSKSYNNTIQIFAEEKELKKQIMSIKTDSTPLEDPKDPDKCAVFKIYSYLASEEERKALRAKYLAGNFGYGEAKNILLEKFLAYFAEARKKRIEMSEKIDYLDSVLEEGAKKASLLAEDTIAKVRQDVGLL